MFFLYILSWLSLLVQFIFITFAIASGLYYFAELAEEYSAITKFLIQKTIYIIIAVLIGLYCFESFSFLLISCGVLAHIFYLLILDSFPVFIVSSTASVLSLLLFLINHYVAFKYFNETNYSFSEVLTYFTLCVWLVPFSLFISLSTNEFSLPTSQESVKSGDDNDILTNYFSRKKRKYNLLTFFEDIKTNYMPISKKYHLKS